MKISGRPRKSLSDEKDYRCLRLPNDMKVLLIRTRARKNLAAVALCVGSGCFNDPSDVQGLSHLLEHVIFMGSEKYPKENEFDRYVSVHGGFDNAYTECEHTLFHFDIIEKHLAGALDRFSQFFITPLMTIESMEREILAVESEFQSNFNDDDVRVSQIFASMIHESHPASNFIWGNQKTLRDGIDSKKLNEKLHSFRRRQYVSNRMSLCIQSTVDFNRLERTVTKYFSDIPCSEDSSLSPPLSQNADEIFKSSFFKKIFFVKSASEKCKLLMTFHFPPMGQALKYLEYLAYLVQYEGSGSLTDLFMDEGLAMGVKCKVGHQSFEGNSAFTLFTIEVNLTSKGFQDVEAVLEVIFAYLLLLKTTSSERHRRRYEEFKEIKQTLFRYRKESSAIENVQELAVNMRYLDDEDIIVGKEIYPDFDKALMKQAIEGVNQNRFNLLILSDKYKNFDQKERWFGTEYAEVDYPKSFTKLWNERWLREELFLPKPNDFICTNFKLHVDDEEYETFEEFPTKILISTTACECFYKGDRRFKLPHGFVNILLSSGLTESSIANLNMTSIFSMCVKNSLSEKLYPATVAGYSYKLHSLDSGLLLRVRGFSEKLPLIVDVITKAIRNISSSTDRSVFETFKRELKKNCRNCLMNGNLLNDDIRLSVLKKHHRTFFDRHDNVDCLQFEAFEKFCELFVDSMKAKILVQGNFIKSHAQLISETVISNLNLLERHEDVEERPAASKIPRGVATLKIPSMNRNDRNSVLKNFYQVGKASISDECLVEFLVNILSEPLFDALRNREQVGYGVSVTLRRNCGILGISITVEYQEDKLTAQTIDSKIEKFLAGFSESLGTLTDGEFASVKQSILAVKLIDDIDLEREVSRNWEEIRSGENLFDRSVLEAFEIGNISKEEVLELFRKTFINDARKLSIRIVGNIDTENSDIELFKSQFSSQFKEFKDSFESFEF